MAGQYKLAASTPQHRLVSQHVSVIVECGFLVVYYAALHPVLSVSWLVGWLVSWSFMYYFFHVFAVFCLTAPVKKNHPVVWHNTHEVPVSHNCLLDIHDCIYICNPDCG